MKFEFPQIASTIFAGQQAWILVVTFTLVWALGLALVLTTRLRNMPYALHFLLAALWCLSSYPLVSLVVRGN